MLTTTLLLHSLLLLGPQCSGGPPPPPPPTWGGPGGDTSTPSRTAPAPPEPTTPSPAPEPASPSTPAPTAPTPVGTPSGGPATPGLAPTTGGSGTLDFAGGWQTWWEFNREPYLMVKDAVYDARAVSPERLEAGLRPSLSMIRDEIVPALLASVRHGEAGDELKGSALLALARIGELEGSELDDSALASLFVEHLSHEHSGVAENACVALGVLGHASAVPVLAAILDDSDEGRKICGRSSIPTYLRAFAAYGLGLIGERSSVVDVRRYAANELMLALEDDTDRNDVRVACVIALGLVDVGGSTDAQVERLLELFEDRREDDAVRAHAATSMARKLEGTSAELRAGVTGELIAATADRSKEPHAVRQSCAIALGVVGDADGDPDDARIRAALMKAAGGKDQMTRSYALMSLARVGARAGDGEGDPYAGTNDVRAFLLKNLARGKAASRPWTALAIGVLGRELALDGVNLPAADITALRMTLEDEKSPHEVAALGLGAGLCGDTDATGNLLARLEKAGDRELVAHTAIALALTGSREAIDPLHETLQDASHDIVTMREAAIALALLHDSRLVPELLEMLDECDCSHSHIAVATALGHTGDARAVAPLVAMLSDDGHPERTRTWAAYALGLVADKEPLPWSSRISVDLNYRANPASLTSPDHSGIIDFP